MSTEMRKYIDTFKQRLTESENANTSNTNYSFTIDDMKKAYNAEKTKKVYFRGDPEGLLRDIPFEQWYKENYGY